MYDGSFVVVGGRVVGARLGDIDGNSDGARVGSALGSSDGAAVGKSLGGSVGGGPTHVGVPQILSCARS